MIDIGNMVRLANPVSGDSTALTKDELDGLLHLIDTRSDNMDVKENLAPVKPPKPKRAPWLVAAAAFVVVLVIGAAALLVLPGGGDSSPARPTETTTAPTPTTTAPESIATTTPPTPTTAGGTRAPSVDLDAALAQVTAHVAGFVDAVNRGGPGRETESLYFPADGQLGCGPVVDESACDSPALWNAPFAQPFLDEWLDHLAAVDTVYEMGECRAIDDHGTVACELQSTSPHAPFYPGHRLEEFQLRFDDDRIDFASLAEVDAFEWKLAEFEFESWLRVNHPDVAASMYTAAGLNGFPQPRITGGSEVYSENLIQYVPQWRDDIESP